jgi:hypothetical protein
MFLTKPWFPLVISITLLITFFLSNLPKYSPPNNSPPSSLTLFDLTYPTIEQLNSNITPTKFNPKKLNFFQLVHNCKKQRKDDLHHEDTHNECSVDDSHPMLTIIDHDKHQDCIAVKEFLKNEFLFCSYDSSHYVEKHNLKQPLGFIISKFGNYFDNFIQNSKGNQTISIPTTSWFGFESGLGDWWYNGVQNNVCYDNNHAVPSILQEMKHDPNDQQQHHQNDPHHQQCQTTDLRSNSHQDPLPSSTHLRYIQDKGQYQNTPTTTNLADSLLTISDLDKKTDIEYRHAQYLHYYATMHLPLLQQHVDSIRAIFGLYGKSGIKSIDGIYTKSRRPSILLNEPWYSVQYIRDALRAKIRIKNFDQIKPILSFFFLHGYSISQADYDKFTSPKGFWGWRPIAIDLRYIKETHAPGLAVFGVGDGIDANGNDSADMGSIVDKSIKRDGLNEPISLPLHGIESKMIDLSHDYDLSGQFDNTNNNDSNNRYIQDKDNLNTAEHNQSVFYHRHSYKNQINQNSNPKNKTSSPNKKQSQHLPHIPEPYSDILNTGFLIELYFVPEDMDVKAVKWHNHHLYEKWRNFIFLPFFQNQMQKDEHDVKIGIPTREIGIIVNEIYQDIISMNDGVQKGENIDKSEHNQHVKQIYIDNNKLEHRSNSMNPILENLPPTQFTILSPGEIYKLWIDYQNDVFTSGFSYTSALERWIINQTKQQHDNTPKQTNIQFGNTPNSNQLPIQSSPNPIINPNSVNISPQDNNSQSFSKIVGPQNTMSNFGTPHTVTDMENLFISSINYNLKRCYDQCETLWQQHAGNDQEWYPNTAICKDPSQNDPS